MSAPLIFLDTETTGLSLDDDIWEFAAIRREPDGTEATMHLFIVHDWEKCQFLPDRFRNEHERRFALHARDAISPGSAAFEISEFMEPTGDQKVHVVGAVPNFDTERIALLLRQFGYEPRWHYHLIDVETLAIGWLARRNGLMRPAEVPRPPWKSDDLSRAVGVEPPGEGERHTAMADARWAMRLYDRIVGGA